MTAAGNLFFMDWEVSFMEWLQAHLPSWSVPVLSAFSFFGEELFLVLILGFLYWSYDKKLGKYVGLNIAVSNTWNPMLKNLVLRLRPFYASNDIKLLRKIDKDADIWDISAQGYSFPSGHSANSLTVFGSLAVYFKKKWLTAVAIIIPLLAGFSRVAVGAHFPTDVFAGWLISLIVIILIPLLHEKIHNKWLFYALVIMLSIPGFFFCKSTDYYTAFGMLLGLILGFEFEAKFVNFENTRSPIRMILRVVLGGALYFGLNTLLKLPFSSDFLSSATTGAFMIRTVRYTVVSFAVIGVYPLLFKLTSKLFAKKQH